MSDALRTIVFTWMKGVPAKVFKHIHQLFLDEESSQFIVTHERISESRLKQDGIIKYQSLNGQI